MENLRSLFDYSDTRWYHRSMSKGIEVEGKNFKVSTKHWNRQVNFHCMKGEKKTPRVFHRITRSFTAKGRTVLAIKRKTFAQLQFPRVDYSYGHYTQYRPVILLKPAALPCQCPARYVAERERAQITLPIKIWVVKRFQATRQRVPRYTTPVTFFCSNWGFFEASGALFVCLFVEHARWISARSTSDIADDFGDHFFFLSFFFSFFFSRYEISRRFEEKMVPSFALARAKLTDRFFSRHAPIFRDSWWTITLFARWCFRLDKIPSGVENDTNF